MKNPLTYSLLFVSLLASCGGCKKDTEQATPAQATNCLIATQTTKELVSPSQTSTLDPETVTINGESFKVTTTKKSAYTYDKQGRILTEYNQYAGSQAGYARTNADSVFYQYSPTAVTIRTVKLTTPKTTDTLVLALDSQGYSKKHRYDTAIYSYDADGYLVAVKDELGKNIAKIDNGNVLELTISDSPVTQTYTRRNEYNLSKFGLPSIQTFNGKTSRNLLIQSVIDDNNGNPIIPEVYKTIYTYKFDDNGRVVRQIGRGKDGEIGYIYGQNTVTTIDYTYICP